MKITMSEKEVKKVVKMFCKYSKSIEDFSEEYLDTGIGRSASVKEIMESLNKGKCPAGLPKFIRSMTLKDGEFVLKIDPSYTFAAVDYANYIRKPVMGILKKYVGLLAKIVKWTEKSEFLKLYELWPEKEEHPTTEETQEKGFCQDPPVKTPAQAVGETDENRKEESPKKVVRLEHIINVCDTITNLCNEMDGAIKSKSKSTANALLDEALCTAKINDLEHIEHAYAWMTNKQLKEYENKVRIMLDADEDEYI